MIRFDLIQTYVAGAHHHAFRGDEMGSLAFGQELFCVREPENEFDKNAIRLNHPDGRKVGYVPKAQAAWLSRLLDHGYDMHASVEYVDAQRALIQITLNLPDLRAER